jgi:hypothetical protein
MKKHIDNNDMKGMDRTLVGFETIQISVDSKVYDVSRPKKLMDAQVFRNEWNAIMVSFKSLKDCGERAIKAMNKKGWRITPAKILSMPNQPFYVHSPEPRHLEV